MTLQAGLAGAALLVTAVALPAQRPAPTRTEAPVFRTLLREGKAA